MNHLKQNPETRHVPVQILTLDQDRSHALASGAFSYVAKPVTSEALDQALSRIKDFAAPRRKRLLVVEDNPAEQLSICTLLGYEDIDVTVVDTGALLSPQSRKDLTIALFSILNFLTCPDLRFWNGFAILGT